jgi:hypothetical protein
MPMYIVENTETKVVSDLPRMSWTDLQKFLSDNPTYKQVVTAPAFVKVY